MALAPEHLSIQGADPLSALSGIRNAGSVFVGQYAAVACGDYSSGTIMSFRRPDMHGCTQGWMYIISARGHRFRP